MLIGRAGYTKPFKTNLELLVFTTRCYNFASKKWVSTIGVTTPSQLHLPHENDIIRFSCETKSIQYDEERLADVPTAVNLQSAPQSSSVLRASVFDRHP